MNNKYLTLKQELAFEFGRIVLQDDKFNYHCEFRHECLDCVDKLVEYFEKNSFKIEEIEDLDVWVMFYCDKNNILMNKGFKNEFKSRKYEIDYK
jgi:hypothetical protein